MKIKPILIIMSVFACALNSFAQSGNLDVTFGASGTVTSDFNASYDEVYCMAIQPDGKIVLGGSADSDVAFALSRFNSNGTIDGTFGTAGKVTVNFTGDNVGLSSIVVQPDGKIVAAGYVNGALNSDIAVARLNADGSLDNSFSGDGKYTYTETFNVTVNTVALQSDGKILVGGEHDDNGGCMLYRFNSNGTLDNSFGTSGVVKIEDVGEICDLKFLSDGKILAAVNTGLNGNSTLFGAARFLSNGTLDNSFGISGIFAMSSNVYESDGLVKMAIQNDGKIVLARIIYDESPYSIGVMKLLVNGSVDNSFDSDGLLLSTIDKPNDDLMNVDIQIQQDNKILLSSSAYKSGTNFNHFLVRRLNNNGTVDNTFGTNGTTYTAIGLREADAFAMGIQTDGKIVLAGIAYTNSGGADFTVARYLSGLTLGVVDFNANTNNVSVYPNPIQENAVLEYSLKNPETITIQLFDMNGKLVKTLATKQYQQPGAYQFPIQVTDVAQGQYLLTISSLTGKIAVQIKK